VSTVLFIVEIVVALGMIIFVHELGHFATAKWFGVRVRRFALGMGPPLIRWVRGETEYSLRAIPVGGFVDLVGEHPEADEADDPRGLWRCRPWQKIVVFSAGVVMNTVLAFLLFALAPIVGIQAPVPVVGGLASGMPAEKAGLLPGDRIVSINDRPIQSFEDIIWSVALVDAGTTFDVKYERPSAQPDQPPTLGEVKVASMRAPGSLAPMLGVEPELNTVIAKMLPKGPSEQAGLKEGDRILSVNGQPVSTWREMKKLMAVAPANELDLKLQRGEETKDLKVDFAAVKDFEFGLEPPTEISEIQPDSPAQKADLRSGDRIAAVQDTPWPTVKATSDLIKAAAGNPVHIVVDRDGKTVDVTVTPAVLPGADYPRLGVSLSAAFQEPVIVGEVAKGGPADEAGLRPGDRILATGKDGRAIGGWEDLLLALTNAEGTPVPLRIQRGAETLTAALTPKRTLRDHLALTDAMGEALYAPLPRIYNPLTAAQRGWNVTLRWFGRVYMNLKQLVTGQVSTKAAAGPVGIAQWSYNVASHGTGTLMEFLGMLTVSIAVLNFLPIPPFDGGHVLFVLIDSARRKPVSMKARNVVWIIGWSLVGLMFIVVTYRDIVRWLTT
jgi:regulator of sigma E protease